MKHTENMKRMINEIIYNCEINNVKNMGNVFFSLAFRSENELKKICNDMNIKTK